MTEPSVEKVIRAELPPAVADAVLEIVGLGDVDVERVPGTRFQLEASCRELRRWILEGREVGSV